MPSHPVLARSARALAVASLAAAGAVADTVVLVPVRDNTLFNIDPPASNGQGPSIFSGRTGAGGGSTVQRAVIDFRVGGIVPAGSTITGATLTLTLEQASFLGNPETHTLHRIMSEWGEGISQGFGGTGAPPETDDATWLHTFYPDQFWTSPGGDFDATVSSSIVIGTVPGVQHVFPSTPQMVADVQGWLDDPSQAFGWVVVGGEADVATAKRFESRESADPSQAPVLTVTYGGSDAVPAASRLSLALVALILLGASLLLRRA